MKNWKNRLDHYLTTAPTDPMEPLYEEIFKQFTPQFIEYYNQHQEIENQIIKWVNKLSAELKYHDYNNQHQTIVFGRLEIKDLTKIIERAFNIFIKPTLK